MSEKRELALYESIERAPDALGQIQNMGTQMAKSGMFGCTKIEQGMVLAMACITHRMTPIEVSQKYHIIDGKLSKKSGAALAEFKAKGGCVRWIRTGQEPTTDPANREAVGEFSVGDSDPMTISFSMQDARNAGLIRAGSAWEKMPWKMLRARVVSDAIGMLAPEIYFGDDMDSHGADLPPEATLFGQQAPITNPEPEHNEKTNKPTIIDADVIEQPDTTDQSKTQETTGLDQRPTPATNSEPTEDAEPDPEKQPTRKSALSDDVLRNIEQVVRDDRDKALAYLRSIKWLGQGEEFESLSPAHATQIINHADAFLANARKI
tara:strand:+ start:2759 stop:3721 length:963 start_codon:yes stop_codon:yes gene_type:complete